MKKIFMMLVLLVMLSGALFADFANYQVNTDNMSGEKSFLIYLVDEESDGKLIMTLNNEDMFFVVTEEYIPYGYNDVEQAMYRFDNNSPVTTIVQLANTGTIAVFFKDTAALWDGIKTSNVLAIRVINSYDGSGRNYTFELFDLQRVLKKIGLM